VTHLGHRVLHLQPGVHLQEEELALRRHDAFDRASIDVTRGRGQRDGGTADALPQGRVQAGCGCLLDQLLEAALDRTFALAQVDDVALRVAEDLHLDVTRRSTKRSANSRPSPK
jgi:hypothetical protein